MQHVRALFRRILVVLLVVSGFFPQVSLAGDVVFQNDVTMFLSGVGAGTSLTVSAGSGTNILTIDATTFTLDVGAGDTFTITWPGPNPGTFTNDGGIDDCNLVGIDNVAVVTGPKVVTFTPSTTVCVASSGGGGSSPGPIFNPTVVVHAPGGTLTAGQETQILWSSGGLGGTAVTAQIALSTDGGVTFSTTIATGEANDGAYLWTVPNVTTASAKIRVTLVDANGGVVASDDGDVFAILGSGEPIPGGVGFSPIAATASSLTISQDKDLIGLSGILLCVPHSLIKGSQKAVYYCGVDGRRYVFPQENTYFTWYPDFKNVLTISDETLADIPLGSNVTARPGIRMVKIQTDPRVYAVEHNGVLRHVTSEAIAQSLYGIDWNKKIIDVSDAFFINYTVGAPVTQ